ncbi:sigma-70 family RNA polymerase sigma factor [uncultured Clostridium sp.]|uniref:RNA polymerase sigma factor n=1 Tax=uncultured Clostridium sp. TaxID=59620 RepID=UPI00260A8CA0|nr:sigma-70 family RNA polymerase sigma factor [uncultured Clostridium sp.]
MNKTNEEILHDIYNETYDDILRYIISKCNNIEDVQDIIQNVYFNFYKAMQKREIESPRKYLFRIARNEIFKTYGLLRVAKNNIPLFSLSSEDIEFNNNDSLSVTENFDSTLICDEIYTYLKQKDALTFKIFLLHFKFDMKIKDISKKLKTSESTVKNRLYRTLKELKNTFEC